MNIFYVHPDPKKCAQQHCDKHVVKMCVEYAQLLSTAHRVLDGEEWRGRSVKGRAVTKYFLPDDEMNEIVYKACHVNHPSTIWTRSSSENYNWLYNMWCELAYEYEHRYGRVHESFNKLELLSLCPPINIKNDEFTEPTPAMAQFPECIVEGDSIASYRNFYWADKREFAKWSKRDIPKWWREYERKG